MLKKHKRNYSDFIPNTGYESWIKLMSKFYYF